jgi:dUTP pyrophosphatase
VNVDALGEEDIEIPVQRLAGTEDLPLPRYMTERAAGMDVHAAVTEDTVVPPGGRQLIPTGLKVAVPPGHEAEIRPRSGLAVRHGVTVLNSPGTIDADYRGEIGILLINHGTEPFVVKRGERIAQMVVRRVGRVRWREAPALDETGRGEGGFGHTRR